jgi:hypothetical protein
LQLSLGLAGKASAENLNGSQCPGFAADRCGGAVVVAPNLGRRKRDEKAEDDAQR